MGHPWSIHGLSMDYPSWLVAMEAFFNSGQTWHSAQNKYIRALRGNSQSPPKSLPNVFRIDNKLNQSDPKMNPKCTEIDFSTDPKVIALGIAARARLGAAGAIEIAVRAPSASLGRSKWPLELPRPRWGVRNGRTSPLGFAGAVEIAAQARSASLKRSH